MRGVRAIPLLVLAAAGFPTLGNEPIGCLDVEYPPQEDSPYVLPYSVGESHNVRQGNCNETNTHNERLNNTFAYDFEMPIGTTLVAARGGKVLLARDRFEDDNNDIARANVVVILHEDGSYARYGHLTKGGVLVDLDEVVSRGQPIALSGNSGLSQAPHLHFDVSRCPEGSRPFSPDCRTVPVSFRNTRPHPHGLQGSPTSAVGGGEWYEALNYEGAPPQKPPYWTIEPLADGVWAALQPSERRFNDANVVIIEETDRLVVVDAPANRDTILELGQNLRRLSSHPVRFVVNTHWHGDHTQGNAVYRELWGDAVSFIGHTSLAEDVPERAAPDVHDRVERLEKRIPEAEARLASGLDEDGRAFTAEEKEQQAAAIERAKQWLERNRDAEFLPPDLAYTDSLILDRGDRRVELHHFRAHTGGDTVVFLPEEKILVTGDLLDDMPYVGHGHPREWLATLRKLAQFDFEIIVPGHGPVFRGRDQLDHVTGFIEALVDAARSAVEAGLSLEQLQETADLTEWRDKLGRDDRGRRFFDQTVAEALQRAYEEAKGDDSLD